jgi:hypothetical protein
MSTKLESLGFKGSAAFILNEEGSGAKYYKSSVYYPDSRTNPISSSGITIDPGVDLGNGDKNMIAQVLCFYRDNYFLNDILLSLLKTSIGLKKLDAAEWINNNERCFKNKVLVPDIAAQNIFSNYSGDDYWQYLILHIPELLSIPFDWIKKAVHTSLLDLAYNYGTGRTVYVAKARIQTGDYEALGNDIKAIRHKSKNLNERRDAEGNLILTACEKKESFVIELRDVNPVPLTTLPFEMQETFTMNFVPLPPKPEL